jgi:thiosulfate/3-mercaptopyruvate sulfurtransferase
MLANVKSRAEQVVDARDEGRFTGRVPDFRPGVPSGHIPNSVNLPFTELYSKNGTFKDKAGLKRAFEKAGVDIDKPIVTTCGGGVTAAVLSFALHLLGKDCGVALYDGSWSEWAVDPDTPKETGPALQSA